MVEDSSIIFATREIEIASKPKKYVRVGIHQQQGSKSQDIIVHEVRPKE